MSSHRQVPLVRRHVVVGLQPAVEPRHELGWEVVLGDEVVEDHGGVPGGFDERGDVTSSPSRSTVPKNSSASQSNPGTGRPLR